MLILALNLCISVLQNKFQTAAFSLTLFPDSLRSALYLFFIMCSSVFSEVITSYTFTLLLCVWFLMSIPSQDVSYQMSSWKGKSTEEFCLRLGCLSFYIWGPNAVTLIESLYVCWRIFLFWGVLRKAWCLLERRHRGQNNAVCVNALSFHWSGIFSDIPLTGKRSKGCLCGWSW